MKPSDHFGFTLVELLVVIAIMVVLFGLAAPALNTLMRGSQLTQASQLVNDQIGFARQYALSKNRSVEVRFYRYGDPGIPGETAANPSSGRYRALQSFEILESGSALALGKSRAFAGSTVIIDSGATLSSIIGNARDASSVPSLSKGTDLKYPVPRVGLNYDSVAIRFQPDGSSNLPLQTASQLWFLTLHEATRGDNLSTPPSNFATIQINPSNGKSRTFRP